MRSFFFVLAVVFVPVLIWRNVLTKKRDRKMVRAWIKELAIAGGISAVISVGLFFALFNNTWRVL